MTSSSTVTQAPLDPATRMVAVTGALDLYLAPEVREALFAAIAAGCRRLVVDLTWTSSVGPSALRALMAADGRLRRAGGELVVVGAAPAVLRTLRVTGLDDVLTLRPGAADALDGAVGHARST